MASLIGTAGHVDHGKTTLIRALTGIDTDRLPEEKKRGLTIDVGFAHIDIPGIGRVSIVDVPGHEKFISNMLVGALGIDVALLCVAADESVMPQTIEHFQIICLLPVQKLVIALTRCDLVDEETLVIARMETEELLAGTRFEGCAIVPVSAVTRSGLDELVKELSNALLSAQPEVGGGWFLPVDRVFTVKGHGTVVTGTLVRGEVKDGDKAILVPEEIEVRIRSIQSHDEAKQQGSRGTRTALNISGAKSEEVHRGQLLGEPGHVWATKTIDARVQWLPDHKLKHGSRVRVSIGADEAIARAFLNDNDSDLLQLRFERPVGVAKGQPLIVRHYSPPDLVCGGKVTVPQADHRRKNQRTEVIDATLSLEDSIIQAVESSQDGMPTGDICKSVGASAQFLGTPLEQLKAGGKLYGFAGVWTSDVQLSKCVERLKFSLENLHKQSPTQLFLPREAVVKAAGLSWTGKPLDRIVAYLEEICVLRVQGTGIALADFKPQFSDRQRELLQRVINELSAKGLSVPTVLDVANNLRVPKHAVEEIIKIGIGAGEVIRIEDGVYIPRIVIETYVAKMREVYAGKQFSASEFRDAMGTSRKYAIPILEYFDAKSITKRIGDFRVVIN